MGISLRGYAKHRGVSLASVQKAIISGRITRELDGTIDQEKCDRMWNENTNPTHHCAKVGTGAVEGVALSIGNERALLVRAQRERVETQNAKILGELVSRKQVEADLFEENRRVRDRLQGIPVRVAPLIASMTDMDAIQKLLSQEIYDALMELSNPDG
ncbi:MAG: hypothetical protein HQL80_10775 [Magnetococcales bacterium]|nr:hypothetical protein [Magnetococcales bacterium]